MEQIVLQVELPSELAAVRTARHGIVDVAGELGCPCIEELALVVSELVANAVQHGRGPVTLRAVRAPHRIRVDVHDTSSSLPHVDRVDLDAERGRGMLIVSTLAEQWGVVHHETGKTVWAAFPC